MGVGGSPFLLAAAGMALRKLLKLQWQNHACVLVYNIRVPACKFGENIWGRHLDGIEAMGGCEKLQFWHEDDHLCPGRC